MNRVPVWAWLAGVALLGLLVYQHYKSKTSSEAKQSAQLAGTLGHADMSTGVWSEGDTVTIEQLQQMQAQVYSWENPPGYMNVKLNQTQLGVLEQELNNLLPVKWHTALTASAPVTSNGLTSPQAG